MPLRGSAAGQYTVASLRRPVTLAGTRTPPGLRGRYKTTADVTIAETTGAVIDVNSEPSS